MSDDTQNSSLFTDHAIKDAFAERHKDDLSAGKYAQKKAIELGLTAAGAGVGFIGGKYIPAYIPERMIPNAIRKILDKDPNALPLIGAGLGMFAGTLPVAYKHWEKEESKRFAVQEVNEDIANVKIRIRTDPELVEENTRLREMLEEKSAETKALIETRNQVVSEVTDKHLGIEKETPNTKISSKGHELAEHTLHAIAEVIAH